MSETKLTKEQLAAIDSYSNDIQTLKDTVTAIRQLPGMYCSGRGNSGFLSLIREIFCICFEFILSGCEGFLSLSCLVSNNLNLWTRYHVESGCNPAMPPSVPWPFWNTFGDPA